MLSQRNTDVVSISVMINTYNISVIIYWLTPEAVFSSICIKSYRPVSSSLQPVAKHGVAWSVYVSVFVCLFVSPAKQLIDEMLFWDTDSGGPREPCVRWGTMLPK